MNDRKLPKSLHTITVLLNVARMVRAYDDARDWRASPASECVDAALAVLGLDALIDEYGLADKATAILEREG